MSEQANPLPPITWHPSKLCWLSDWVMITTKQGKIKRARAYANFEHTSWQLEEDGSEISVSQVSSWEWEELP